MELYVRRFGWRNSSLNYVDALYHLPNVLQWNNSVDFLHITFLKADILSDTDITISWILAQSTTGRICTNDNLVMLERAWCRVTPVRHADIRIHTNVELVSMIDAFLGQMELFPLYQFSRVFQLPLFLDQKLKRAANLANLRWTNSDAVRCHFWHVNNQLFVPSMSLTPRSYCQKAPLHKLSGHTSKGKLTWKKSRSLKRASHRNTVRYTSWQAV